MSYDHSEDQDDDSMSEEGGEDHLQGIYGSVDEGELDYLADKFEMGYQVKEGVAKIIKFEFVVDPEKGTYYSIQEAINSVQQDNKEKSLISVNSGLYKENLMIKNKSVLITCRDTNSEVYISGESGPTVIIDNDPKYEVELCGVKLSFKGKHLKENELEKSIMSLKTKGQAPALNDSVELSVLKECYDMFNEIDIKDDTDTIIFLKRGRLVLKQCVINLNLMLKDFKGKLTGLAILEGTEVEMVDCEVRGKIDIDALGMYVDKGNFSMTRVTFRDFKRGAIIVNSAPQNKNLIRDCIITFNKTVGLMLMGNNKNTIVENSIIERNECPGIQILPGNKAIIRGNSISINTHGIRIKSADPIILDNKIKQNYKSGLFIGTVKTKELGREATRKFEQDRFCLLARPRVLLNEISSNKENGIVCVGANNNAIIQENTISFNVLCGVKTQQLASPLIKFNKICKNNAQGVLLVENSWATVIHNEISENLKANVALGGVDSTNTFVCNNKISQGLSEGIFVVKSGRCVIRGNEIVGNRDGIIMADSLAEVTSNLIKDNQKNGVFLLQSSKPMIKYNRIEDNLATGLYIKGRANPAKILKNNFAGNAVAVLYERKCAGMEDTKKLNEFAEQEGDGNGVVFPSIGCSLI